MDLEIFKSFFARKEIQTLAELVEKMGTTPQTARNHLKRAAALTSYNKRGMYYTLPRTPTFDNNGNLEFLSDKIEDTTEYRMSSDKSINKLNFHPKFTLKTALEDMKKYYEETV